MKIVYIKWVDSFGVSSHWTEVPEEIKDDAHFCESVGWLILDGENIKVVAPHISPENEDIGAVLTCCGDMAIPVSAIVEMITLTEDIKQLTKVGVHSPDSPTPKGG